MRKSFPYERKENLRIKKKELEALKGGKTFSSSSPLSRGRGERVEEEKRGKAPSSVWVAQLVEQRTENPCVGGSSPLLDTVDPVSGSAYRAPHPARPPERPGGGRSLSLPFGRPCGAGQQKSPFSLVVRTPPFRGGETSSILVRDAGSRERRVSRRKSSEKEKKWKWKKH